MGYYEYITQIALWSMLCAILLFMFVTVIRIVVRNQKIQQEEIEALYVIIECTNKRILEYERMEFGYSLRIQDMQDKIDRLREIEYSYMLKEFEQMSDIVDDMEIEFIDKGGEENAVL